MHRADRLAESRLRDRAKQFPTVMVVGPRQVGTSIPVLRVFSFPAHQRRGDLGDGARVVPAYQRVGASLLAVIF
jgi:hypothetical protein